MPCLIICSNNSFRGRIFLKNHNKIFKCLKSFEDVKTQMGLNNKKRNLTLWILRSLLRGECILQDIF